MNKIHCLNPIAKVGTDKFGENYQLSDNLEDAAGIMVRSADMHKLQLPDSLLAVARAGAGVNNIPLEELASKGVVVFNTPGANANGVKELVICGMLLASRDIVGGVEWIKSIKENPDISKEVEKGKKKFAGTEIEGKNLGVIGLGAIGADVANAARALGMKVYGYDPFISVNAAWRLSRRVEHITDPDVLFQKCDYITLHIPAKEETRGFIGKDAISKMKDGVIVLNFARDTLVDDDAMAEALSSGKVRKYVTDFPNTKSVKMENVITIPHLGASTAESEDNCAIMAADEIKDYIENGNIHNSVNYPNCDLGVCASVSRVAMLHKNIPNMLGQITSVLAKDGVNIANLVNKGRGGYAYTLLDLEKKLDKSVIDDLKSIENVFKVRIVK